MFAKSLRRGEKRELFMLIEGEGEGRITENVNSNFKLRLLSFFVIAASLKAFGGPGHAAQSAYGINPALAPGLLKFSTEYGHPSQEVVKT